MKDVLSRADWLPEFTWIDSLSPFQLMLLSLVTISCLTILFLVTHVIVLMLLRNRRQRWVLAMQARMEDDIAIWLASDYSTRELSMAFQQELKKDSRAAGVILDVILATSKLIRREGQSALRELLISLNLHLTCYRLLKSGHWYRQAYATQLIGQLQLSLALPLLKQKVNTHNKTLRLELITALVALGDQSWLQAIDLTSTRLSDWEQILLLERFRRLDTNQLPPFEQWLTSGHPDWTLFGIRLCRYYNRFDTVPGLGALLAHPEERVQLAVLDAFDYLGSPESVPFLTSYMQQATGERLQCALTVLGKQGDPDTIQLLLPYTEHADAGVQLSALRALKEVGLSKVELRQLSSTPQHIDHLFDPKLP